MPRIYPPGAETSARAFTGRPPLISKGLYRLAALYIPIRWHRLLPHEAYATKRQLTKKAQNDSETAVLRESQAAIARRLSSSAASVMKSGKATRI